MVISNLPHFRYLLIGSLFVLVTLFFSLDSQASRDANTFHSTEEFAFFTTLTDSLPRGYNGLFAGSGECVQCHGFDTAMIASLDPQGNDINLVDDWRATMMANSAKDPFWRAKVSHEVLLHPQYMEAIETKCTTCHAPLGHFAAFHQGAESYTIDEMVNDSIALDGVSCLACHQQSEENLGNGHSGELVFETERLAFGPFISPLSSPMLEASQYEPVYSPHISDAGVCAGCHTLITETIDLEGNFTGGTYVEQATYHEWLNSNYAVDNVSCQSCHMPTLQKGQFYLAAGFETVPRDKFSLHELAGANVNMLKLMKDNAAELQISATPQDFDAVITATENMLRFRTMEVALTDLDRTADTAFVALRLTNMAGHKFPSGYPSRRAFVSLVVRTAEGDTLFHSGEYDANYELTGHDASYEPHYATIRSADQVQIYEQVLGDVNNQKTTVLLRAASALKDNRIPPKGFTQSHAVYDTTRISGEALFDTDFNVNELGEGSGSDVVYYHIPTLGYLDELDITATVYYQSMPPKWMAEMFAESTPEIDLFVEMFNEAERTPSLVGEDELTMAGIVGLQPVTPTLDAEVFLANDRQLMVQTPVATELTIYNYLGQQLQQQRLSAGSSYVPLQFKRQIIIVYLNSPEGTFTRTLWVN
ncbi:hypothetical protein [Lewinella cohaerens]|uniref:hypothetical protein n=1 Tax=Lewinella cohaerens TaxID=70995 RepID=UPI00036DC1F9|nr:hypothetical protein [Lewinella cohaerens]